LHCLAAKIEKFLIGTAWLSSARVVECSIYLLNERNLQYKYQIFSLLMKRNTLNKIIFYLFYDKANNQNLKTINSFK